MNYNEEIPDFLGRLGDMLPADVLKMVNESTWINNLSSEPHPQPPSLTP